MRRPKTHMCALSIANMSNSDVSTSHMMADYLDRIGAGKVSSGLRVVEPVVGQ